MNENNMEYISWNRFNIVRSVCGLDRWRYRYPWVIIVDDRLWYSGIQLPIGQGASRWGSPLCRCLFALPSLPYAERAADYDRDQGKQGQVDEERQPTHNSKANTLNSPRPTLQTKTTPAPFIITWPLVDISEEAIDRSHNKQLTSERESFVILSLCLF